MRMPDRPTGRKVTMIHDISGNKHKHICFSTTYVAYLNYNQSRVTSSAYVVLHAVVIDLEWCRILSASNDYRQDLTNGHWQANLGVESLPLSNSIPPWSFLVDNMYMMVESFRASRNVCPIRRGYLYDTLSRAWILLIAEMTGVCGAEWHLPGRSIKVR